MILLPQLLTLSGSGQNCGKTSSACLLIDKFISLQPIAVKISPHFHHYSSGKLCFSVKGKYEIYQEVLDNTSKDSSRMLKAGASKVFYMQVKDRNLEEAFSLILTEIKDRPIICESGGLHKHFKPGLQLFFYKDIIPSTKSNSYVPDLKIQFNPDTIQHHLCPIEFSNKSWQLVF